MGRLLPRAAALALAAALLPGCAGAPPARRAPEGTPAQKLYWEGQLAVQKGDPDRAMERFEASRALAEKEGSREGLASSLHAIAMIHVQREHFREALAALLRVLSLDRKALEEAQRAGKPAAELAALEAKVAGGLYDIARVHRRQGDAENTLRRLREALAIDLRLGRERGAAITHNNVGRILLALDRLGEAETHYKAALALFEKIKDEARAQEVRYNLEFLETVRRRAGKGTGR